MTDQARPRSTLKLVRILLWMLVVLALAGSAALLLYPRGDGRSDDQSQTTPAKTHFGGPFTLVGADEKPFSSSRLAGKPYAIFFGYTRCGDICPTTLARLVKLRQQAGPADAFNIVFVTIDPTNDGPKEVGQYTELFGAPIIGLTGTESQIDRVKKQYGIFAEPDMSGGAHGTMIDHTATVLLFDRKGGFAGTIAASEADDAAVAKMKRLIG